MALSRDHMTTLRLVMDVRLLKRVCHFSFPLIHWPQDCCSASHCMRYGMEVYGESTALPHCHACCYTAEAIRGVLVWVSCMVEPVMCLGL